jgi:hypothetical protein
MIPAAKRRGESSCRRALLCGGPPVSDTGACASHPRAHVHFCRLALGLTERLGESDGTPTHFLVFCLRRAHFGAGSSKARSRGIAAELPIAASACVAAAGGQADHDEADQDSGFVSGQAASQSERSLAVVEGGRHEEILTLSRRGGRAKAGLYQRHSATDDPIVRSITLALVIALTLVGCASTETRQPRSR